MQKFIHRLIYILLGGLFLFGISLGRISDIPGFDYIVAFLWGGVVALLCLALGRRKGWWVLLVVVLLGQPEHAWADSSVQSYYKTYCAKAEQAKQNNWKGEKECDAEVLEKARYITASQKGTTTNVGNQNEVLCSCSSEYDCAQKLMTLCSNYERRHHLENEKNKKVHTVMEILANEESGCWPCDMAAVVFVVIQNLSFTLNSVMVQVAFMLLKLFFLGWIIFTGITSIAFPSKTSTFVSQTLIRFIVVSLVAIVLSSNGMTALYTNFLNPVMGIGIGLSEKVSEAALPTDNFGTTITNLVSSSTPTTTRTSMNYCQTGNSASFSNMMNNFLGNMSSRLLSSREMGYSSYNSNVNSYMATTLSQQLIPLNNDSNQESLLNDQMKNQLLCMTQKFYNQVGPFTAMGQSLVEFSRADESSYFGLKFPNLGMWLTGWLLVGVFTIFGFLVAFRLMDIFMRLALFLIMIPWCVVAIAFPITRDFTRKGWNFFLHTIVEFLGLALAIALVMVMFESVVSPDSDNLRNAIMAPYSKDYGQNLYDVIYSGGAGRFFFMLIISAYFALKIMQSMTSILEGLFGVSGATSAGLFSEMAMTTVARAQQMTRKATEISNNKNLRFKTADMEKEEDIKTMKKDLPRLQDNINLRALQRDNLAKKAAEMVAQKEQAERKAALASATQAEKKAALEAAKKAQEAQKEAEMAEKKLQLAKQQLLNKQAKIAAAENELKNMYLGFKTSSASFAPRRYAENSANALHYYSQKMAGKAERILVGGGQLLNKTGIGAIIGVPMVYAGKLISWGLRGTTKTISSTVHAVGATPETVKNTVSAVVNAPKNIVKGVQQGVKNATETTKDLVGFSLHMTKKATYDVPKAAIKETVSAVVNAPQNIAKGVKEAAETTKDVVGFSAHVVKKATYDVPKEAIRGTVSAVVNAPQNIVQGVKSAGTATKEAAGFAKYMAKKVAYDNPKAAIKGAVSAVANAPRNTMRKIKNAAKFPGDLVKKIFK